MPADIRLVSRPLRRGWRSCLAAARQSWRRSDCACVVRRASTRQATAVARSGLRTSLSALRGWRCLRRGCASLVARRLSGCQALSGGRSLRGLDTSSRESGTRRSPFFGTRVRVPGDEPPRPPPLHWAAGEALRVQSKRARGSNGAHGTCSRAGPGARAFGCGSNDGPMWSRGGLGQRVNTGEMLSSWTARHLREAC